MRDIKFRGIRRDNKEFVYGDGIHFPKSINYKGRCYIDGMQEKANDWMEVMPETVGQFTGLKDKNGKEIYEGDILKRPDSEINYIVIFNGGCFCIQNSKNKHHNLTLLDGISTFLEITGNIYENPELLEAKE